jgi:type IV secretory pathway VirB3-like protein
VVIWRCFWRGSFGPLEIIVTESVDQETYIIILANRFHLWFTGVTMHQERDFIIQEDGASCHTGGYARWWKEAYQIRDFAYWPAQSPDLNSIAHV